MLSLPGVPVLITNAKIINEGRERHGDVLIANGRIERIGAGLVVPEHTEIFDARERWLLPGLIDDQVHFREPGLTHKGDIASESAAAAAGGITSFMDMPNTRPQTVTRERLAEKYALAEGRAYANYAFYLGATHHNLAEIEALAPNEACGVKVFMGASTGDMLVDDPATLEKIFARAPVLIATHCEDTPMIRAQEEAFRARYGERVPFSAHPLIRSADACYQSSELAVRLARRHGAKLHVLHLTTARELDLFEPGPVGGKRITCEACAHHLFLDDTHYDALGAKIKCNPAIKTAADRAALVAGVRDGRINLIATDHAPHAAEEKAQTYFHAPAGLPLVQHALLILIELVKRGELNLRTVVERACHAPAERFGIEDRGYIREGCWADLVLVDPDAHTAVTADNLLYKCGWSPFEGMTFSSRVIATWVNGRLAYANGRLTPEPYGQRIEFRA